MPLPTVAAPRWREPVAAPGAGPISEAAGHPLVGRVLAARGFSDPDAVARFLDPYHHPRSDPRTFPGVNQAIERLRQAHARGERVLVWGDFDVDGQTATALMTIALRRSGIDAIWYVPDRERESHGVGPTAPTIVDVRGASLIVTCDCGLVDLRVISALAARGVDTIVTDHHAPGDGSVAVDHPARAVVAAARLPTDHPARHLAGAGMAYALAAPFLATFQQSGQDLLDLVALGTIADVAALIGDNRRLVARGLPSLNQGRRPGIGALLRDALRREVDDVETSLAGWTIGPRLNALGRLGDASRGVELLLATDPRDLDRLGTLAAHLNEERQAIGGRVQEEAIEILDRPAEDVAHRDPVEGLAWSDRDAIVLAREDWPIGIIGLIAQRLAQDYLRPCALVAISGAEGRVSIRSPEWCDLVPVLRELQADEQLDFSGGGHASAAGGRIPGGRIARFAHLFASAVARQRPAGELMVIHRPEVAIDLTDVSLAAHRALRRLAPFGRGNLEPLFIARDVEVLEARAIGEAGRHRAYVLGNGRGTRARAVHWNAVPVEPGARVDVLAHLGQDAFNEFVGPRLTIRDIRPAR